MTQAIVTTPSLSRAEKFAKRIEVLTKRIAADTVALEAVTLESTTAGRLDGVVAGTIVTARLGRAGSAAVEAVAEVPSFYEADGVTINAGSPAVAAKAGTEGTLRFVTATVLAIKELEDGSLRYKVQHGEGFDSDIEVIQATQITEVAA
jgi:hypothetical protein